MAKVKVCPRARAALRMLDAVLRRGETLDLAEAPRRQGPAPRATAALARAIAGEVLRWLVDLDALIDSATAAGPARRCQAAHGAADDAGAMAAARHPAARGDRDRAANCSPAGRGGWRTGCSRRWSSAAPPLPDRRRPCRRRWPRAGASAPMRSPARWQSRRRSTSRCSDPRRNRSLGRASWAASRSRPGHVRLARGSAVERLDGFEEGAWWVQDLAASLPARLLGPGEGERVLDLCAAPGGKTLQLAAAGWQVTALDNSAKRLDRLRENLARTGLSGRGGRGRRARLGARTRRSTPSCSTRRAPPPAPPAAIPTCSTASARARSPRWPNCRRRCWRARRAGSSPGGTLIYAVCSLEPEEGEEQVDAVALTPRPIGAENFPPASRPPPKAGCGPIRGCCRTTAVSMDSSSRGGGNRGRPGTAVWAVSECPLSGEGPGLRMSESGWEGRLSRAQRPCQT